VDSKAYENEILKVDSSLSVSSVSCPMFVPLVEEGWLDGEVPEKIAEKYLDTLKSSEIDTLILGCTHYPLLKSLFSKILGNEIILVDSAEETAKTIKKLLEENKLVSSKSGAEKLFFVSDLPRRFEVLGQRFLGEIIAKVAIAEPWKSVRPNTASE